MNDSGQTLQQQTFTPYQPPMPEFLTKDDKDLLKRTMLKKFAEDQQEVFIRRCERSKLDPFSGQIHPTMRNTRVRREDGTVEWVPTLVCVTGIYGLLAVAIRTGEYDGSELFWCGEDGKWRDEWLENYYPAAAKAIVYLKHRSRPEVMIARWFSFVQQTYSKEAKKWEVGDFWDRMPDYMISKCARAGALRAAFPDQLSEIYIREELQGQLELGDEDTAKIAENQRREKEVFIPGARVVASSGPRPTPEEALEPAFDEDKIPPPKQTWGEKLAQEQKFAQQTATVSAQTQDKSKPPAPAVVTAEPKEEDDLDFGAPAQGAAAIGSSPAPAPEPEPAWKSHVLKGITNSRFFNRKLGDLNEVERGVLETQWLPKIQEQWDKANEAQRADYPMVQAAIAYHKLAKPWQA